MVEMWKRDERLRPFDLYFRWKTHEITMGEWRNNRDAIRQMRREAKRMISELFDFENTDPKNEELTQVVDAIDEELINISIILGIH